MKSVDELQVYNLSVELGEKIWNVVMKWNYFEKDTVGKQLVKAADSVAANLSEGFGRFHYSDKKNFSYYSRGSLFETKTWIKKAYDRKLISEADFTVFSKDIDTIGRMLNNYIKSIGTTNAVASMPNDQ